MKKPILSAIAFFGTLGVLSVGYSAYSWLFAATAGTPLSVALWTQVKDNFDDLNSRLSNFSFSSGNVGIGAASPVAKLQVNGPMIRSVAYASANGPTDEMNAWQIVSRILSFTKLWASTKIRISYTDAMRTYWAGSCRWEIKIDWASCPAQPLVYDVYSNGADNPHHSRTVVGYCGGVSAGTKQIQVWTWPTPGHGAGDCYTWFYNSTWVIEAEEVN